MSRADDDIARLNAIIDELRRIRERTCEPKANTNPRYIGLSNAVSGINRAIESIQAEDREQPQG